jgi:hypothetical protein
MIDDRTDGNDRYHHRPNKRNRPIDSCDNDDN